MTTAVVTIAAGRHDHLRAQEAGLRSGTAQPDVRVIVAMGDPDVPGATVVVPADGALPLARARNVGARLALDAGAEVLVFLDVDCIPAPNLVASYTEHVRDGVVLCGPVTYLPRGADPGRLAELVNPHAARPNPPAGQVERGENWDLFWSLSFAVTATTWTDLGGFCEDYEGYGGEDTDFGWTARERGAHLHWLGGAHAFHQWHPVSSPPVERLDDIVVNARVFHRRWGRWPMTGWLTAFAERGLVEWDPDGGTLERRRRA
ncbi:glycosyltransferase family 2 protein [Rhodococcoides corynebacterioides]|uniref:Glycosyltransferase family 2 protein n=1 Tax=Rhodococcoides corynebacterioides TaxID=53972 RepID=A0ABS7P5Z7_9NOCA|nr:glycosyltransferase family 2 protein [Rhodococcus corynebacterioides]MBY6367847.1 glycosyltransferase family 2 protein [Rhodococcus corynebacterioides]MBY6408328.1 glycosyltransferase family 2 protein [Rhodococcus corynebacterioides]